MLAGMEVTRDELESLIAEALLRDSTFRPKRRNWNETWEQDERRARITAARNCHLPLRLRSALGEAPASTGAPDASCLAKAVLWPASAGNKRPLDTIPYLRYLAPESGQAAYCETLA